MTKAEIIQDYLEPLETLDDESLITIWLALAGQLAQACPDKLGRALSGTCVETITAVAANQPPNGMEEFTVVLDLAVQEIQKGLDIGRWAESEAATLAADKANEN